MMTAKPPQGSVWIGYDMRSASSACGALALLRAGGQLQRISQARRKALHI